VEPILRRPQTLSPITVTGALSAGDAEVHGYSDVGISGDVEQQIAAIKNRLRDLTNTIVAHDKQMRKLGKETKKGFKRERSEREKAVTEVRREIKEATLGNTALDLIGVGLFAIGIVFSSGRRLRRGPALLKFEVCTALGSSLMRL